MTVRVGINGFGRVGRCAFRHDTVYGPFPGLVGVDEGALVVVGTRIPVSHAV
jgi:glyceraldehyde-3-phosphate dehydrogenase/erythrose-4-phosphate dehydrogenase